MASNGGTQPPTQLIGILQRFQNKYLRIIANAPITLHIMISTLKTPYVKDEIKRLNQRYVRDTID